MQPEYQVMGDDVDCLAVEATRDAAIAWIERFIAREKDWGGYEFITVDRVIIDDRGRTAEFFREDR